jgi:HlyD family secretion protein
MRQTTKWRTQGIARWRRHVLSITVWLAAVGASGWLLAHRATRFDAVGIARGESRSIAALTRGRILAVAVNPFETVARGQTLVVLEDDRIQAELATATAEAQRLRAKLTATEAQLIAEAEAQQTEQLRDARRFAVDVESKRIQELELTAAMRRDEVSLEYLRLRKDALGQLRGTGATATFDWRAAETQYAETETRIEQARSTLAQLQQDLADARGRQADYAQHHPALPAFDGALQPLREAVTTQEQRLAELTLERSMLRLTSPMDGVVSQILRRVGETVTAGEPILTVTAPQPAEVVLYVNAGQARRFRVGTPIELGTVGLGDVHLTAPSKVMGIGPAAEQLPARLWQSPNVPEWGWPIGIAVSSELKLMPGELVEVRAL